MQLHRALEVFALHVLERADFDDAGVVDENVDGSEMRQNRSDSFFDLRAIEQVAWDDGDVAAGRGEFIVRATEFLDIAREQRDTTAVRTDLTRQHQTEAT
jgi:hypothetical protein